MPFFNLDNFEAREIVPGYRARFLHTEEITLAYWEVDRGAELPEHSHPQEQVANVMEGQFELTVDGVTRTLGPGEAAVISGGVLHSGRAITPCRLLDVFHPPREDYA
ncbi:MAG: cupin domain-containing protein [Anaerolineales bacterium]|nr:cupin domain-containing protein [Anaerolineales bacterium]